jgi:predicted enzyme related to lactoylglutathione lyase
VTAIYGLAGVIISTTSDRFQEMADFYTGVLGLTPRSRRHHFLNFEWGSQRLTLTLHSEVRGATGERARIIVNLACSDVDGEAAGIAGRGGMVVRPPETESWGGRICTIADPDGNLIQLIDVTP